MKLHRPKDKNMYLMTLGSLRPTLREYDSITGLGRVLLRNQLLTGKASVVSKTVYTAVCGGYVTLDITRRPPTYPLFGVEPHLAT